MTLSRRRLLASLSAFALLSAGPTSAQEAGKQELLRVVASFSILGDMAREIGGERVNVMTLVGPNADAHVYAPTPSDAKAVSEARLIVLNGLKFEGWIDRLLRSSGTKAPQVVATKGVNAIKVAGGHSHGQKDRHGHSHAGEADPHAWQDVANAKIYAANIRDGLIGADPAGKAIYEANAARYIAALDALDAEIRAAFAGIPAAERKIITGHDAFGYFSRAYGVRFISPKGVSTEAEASAKDVAQVIRQAKAEKVKAIFLENIANPALSEQIARETGAKMGGRLYSDALSEPSGPAGTYIAMMRHNAKTITAALAP
jgi:zinc/manganese transport system substrate-binding protein